MSNEKYTYILKEIPSPLSEQFDENCIPIVKNLLNEDYEWEETELLSILETYKNNQTLVSLVVNKDILSMADYWDFLIENNDDNYDILIEELTKVDFTSNKRNAFYQFLFDNIGYANISKYLNVENTETELSQYFLYFLIDFYAEKRMDSFYAPLLPKEFGNIFAFIKDGGTVKRFMQSLEVNENVMHMNEKEYLYAMIVNNKHISEYIRQEAFELGADYKKITHLTEDIKRTLYKMTMETIFDTQNMTEETDEIIQVKSEAFSLLKNLIKNGMPYDCEIDLYNRITENSKTKKNMTIIEKECLIKLCRETKHEDILEKIISLDTNIIYNAIKEDEMSDELFKKIFRKLLKKCQNITFFKEYNSVIINFVKEGLEREILKESDYEKMLNLKNETINYIIALHTHPSINTLQTLSKNETSATSWFAKLNIMLQEELFTKEERKKVIEFIADIKFMEIETFVNADGDISQYSGPSIQTQEQLDRYIDIYEKIKELDMDKKEICDNAISLSKLVLEINKLNQKEDIRENTSYCLISKLRRITSDLCKDGILGIYKNIDNVVHEFNRINDELNNRGISTELEMMY